MNNVTMCEFDEKTQRELRYYVYCLVDPTNNKPFYVGKGIGNRVFEHARAALKKTDESDKLDIIRKIHRNKNEVVNLIIKHGMTEDEAFAVESSIIDFSNYFKIPLANLVLGHGSSGFGLMTIDEIRRKYEAEPLKNIENGCVIININRRYQRAGDAQTIYDAVRKSWVIGDRRIGDPENPSLKYVLAEFRGFIVEIFEVSKWYRTPDDNEKTRWGFEGKIAPDCVRNKYLNRSIERRRGAANPIIYNL